MDVTFYKSVKAKKKKLTKEFNKRFPAVKDMFSSFNHDQDMRNHDSQLGTSLTQSQFQIGDIYDSSIVSEKDVKSDTASCPDCSVGGIATNLVDEDCLDYNSALDLSKAFAVMLEKGYFADVTIKCGSEVFMAHKNVLSTRSPVFEAMFTSPMQENMLNTLTIEDMEPPALRALLSFVYSGQVRDLDVSVVCDLLYAAEKYQMGSLKRVCVRNLMSNLAESNVLRVLQCAELHDSELKVKALSFISERFSALKVTEEWNAMQKDNPTLALEVYSHVVNELQDKK